VGSSFLASLGEADIIVAIAHHLAGDAIRKVEEREVVAPDVGPDHEKDFSLLMMKSLLQTLIQRTEQSATVIHKYSLGKDHIAQLQQQQDIFSVPSELENQLLSLEDLSKACYGLRLMTTTAIR
jgi:hypothetical protein